MTQKTAEQIKQAQADAFEYGMGKFLRKTGLVKTAEDVQVFLKIAAEAAQNTPTWEELENSGIKDLESRTSAFAPQPQVADGPSEWIEGQAARVDDPRGDQSQSLLERLKALATPRNLGIGAGVVGGGAGLYALSRLLGGGSAEEEEEEV